MTKFVAILFELTVQYLTENTSLRTVKARDTHDEFNVDKTCTIIPFNFIKRVLYNINLNKKHGYSFNYILIMYVKLYISFSTMTISKTFINDESMLSNQVTQNTPKDHKSWVKNQFDFSIQYFSIISIKYPLVLMNDDVKEK